MDIVWSYYLIAALYAIILLLKVINKKQNQTFKAQHETSEVYGIYKRDFFYTIALVCTTITILINVTALVTGRPLVGHSLVITVLIVGMAYLTGRTQLLASQTMLSIDGIHVPIEQIQEVKVKDKAKKVTYHLLLQEPINGYESIVFESKKEYKASIDDFMPNNQ